MDQDRRDAAAWAKEWQIKRRNQRILYILAAVLLVVVIGYGVNFAIIKFERTTFRSAEDMRKAMQGRYELDRYYVDVIIEGDSLELTYYSYSHYNREYAEKYGYDAEKDAVYEDHVVKWDYRHGVIKTGWLGDIKVDKNGNIKRGNSDYDTFYKTDKPRPEPIDPSTLRKSEGSTDAELTEDVLNGRDESLDSTEEAANEAAEDGLDTGTQLPAEDGEDA